jgi:26S proteasome regulatory subunit N1
LLIEVRQLNKLVDTPVVDERNHERVCLYIIRSAAFIADPEDLDVLFKTAYSIYKNQKKYTDALRVALKLDNMEYVAELFSDSVGAPDIQKTQMAHILGRAHSSFTIEENEQLNEIIGNCGLSERYLAVIADLDLATPKTPEDIFKTNVTAAVGRARAGAVGAGVDSARANLASTFVNAFVNAGYCSDKLLIGGDAEADGGGGWLFKNKGHGMMSAAASTGMLMMWNVEEGLNQIDKYFHNGDDFVQAGACLGTYLDILMHVTICCLHPCSLILLL